MSAIVRCLVLLPLCFSNVRKSILFIYMYPSLRVFAGRYTFTLLQAQACATCIIDDQI